MSNVSLSTGTPLPSSASYTIHNIIGTELRPRTFDANVAPESYFKRVASTWFERNDQICFTALTDRGVKVISTGITEEMIQNFRKGNSSPEEILLIKNFIKSGLGQDLFNRISDNDKSLMIVSLLLLAPGDNIKYVKSLIASPNRTAKLNLLEKYPSLVKLDAKHFDKLLSLTQPQLEFLVDHPQLLENLNPETLEKILSLESSETLLTALSYYRRPNLLSKLQPHFFDQEALVNDPEKILSILEHSPQLLENLKPETLTKILSLPSCEDILETLSDFNHADLIAKLEPNFFDKMPAPVLENPKKVLSLLDANPDFLRKLDEATLDKIFSLEHPDNVLFALNYCPELIQNPDQLNNVLNESNPEQYFQWLLSVKLGQR